MLNIAKQTAKTYASVYRIPMDLYEFAVSSQTYGVKWHVIIGLKARGWSK